MKVSVSIHQALRVIAFIPLLFLLPNLAFAGVPILEIVIETRIHSPDPFPGMKSKQVVTVQRENKNKLSFSGGYKTGTTDFFGVSLNSVRNNFKIENTRSSKYKYGFKVTGETATGVGVVPNINYSFDISYSTKERAFSIQGCHDGYPGYKVTARFLKSGKTVTVYNFKHKSVDLLKLFGSCDTNVKRTVSVKN